MKKYILVLLTSINISSLCCAASDTTLLSFLKLDTSAKVSSLGSAYTAVSGDINSLNYNPAGLSNIGINQIAFMHNWLFQDVNQDYLAFVHKHGIGISINRLQYGQIPRTTISNPLGIGHYSMSDLEIKLGYGHKINEGLDIGLGCKFVQEKIDTYSGQGFAIDFGGLYETPMEGVKLGFAMQNIGLTKIKFLSIENSFPLNTKLGASFRNSKFMATAELNYDRGGNMIFNLGVEYFLYKIVNIRAGYSSRNEAGEGLTLGFGIDINNFNFDYAFSNYGQLGNTNRISMSYRFDKIGEVLPFIVKPSAYVGEKTAVRSIIKEKPEVIPEEIVISTAVIRKETKIVEGMILTEKIYFRSKSKKVVPENYPVLDKIGQILKSNNSYCAIIIGHNDESDDSFKDYRISIERAQSVLEYFIKTKKMSPQRFSISGYGASEPVAPNDNEENRRKNRRVEIKIISRPTLK